MAGILNGKLVGSTCSVTLCAKPAADLDVVDAAERTSEGSAAAGGAASATVSAAAGATARRGFERGFLRAGRRAGRIVFRAGVAGCSASLVAAAIDGATRGLRPSTRTGRDALAGGGSSAE